MRLWDANTGAELLSLGGHLWSVSAVAFSIDGKRIITGSVDGTAKLWHAATGAELMTIGKLNGSVANVFFGPGGESIVVASEDGVVKFISSSPDAKEQH